MFKITKEYAIKFLENIIKKIKKDEILLYSLNRLKNILVEEFNFFKNINNTSDEDDEEPPKRPYTYKKKRPKKLLNRK
tara:strand:+ start:4517 stop:4750 length:234 start_codon:yes stop_codon:yes gene_type:complete